MMKPVHLGQLAATLIGILVVKQAAAMDVETQKDKKTGKEYFCANAQCAGNSTCMGAGNTNCGSINKCAKDLGYPVGWTAGGDKAECEKGGAGKWLPFKKEYSIKSGNVAPLASMKQKPKPVSETKPK